VAADTSYNRDKAKRIGTRLRDGKHAMFDFGKYVDAVYVLHFSGNAWRRRYLEPELRRVGLLGSPLLHWRISGAKPFLSSDRIDASNRYAHDIIHENIDILEDALDEGYSRIMVMEDDIAFVKDLYAISLAFNKTPPGFSVLHLEWVTSKPGLLPKGERWSGDVHMTLGEGCSVFSRTGMKELLNRISAPGFRPIDLVSRDIPGCHVATPRLAIQLPFLSSGSNGAYGVAGHVLSEDWKRYSFPDDFIPGVGVVPGKKCFESLIPAVVAAVAEHMSSGTLSDPTCGRLYRAASEHRGENPAAYAVAMAMIASARQGLVSPYLALAKLCPKSSFPGDEQRRILKMASEVAGDNFDRDIYSVPGPSGDLAGDVSNADMEPLFRDIVESSAPGDLDGPDGDLIRFSAYQLPEWRDVEESSNGLDG